MTRGEAGAIRRCESGPGRDQQSAWKRVLREAAAMPNTKRTQRVRGCGSGPRNDELAEAETVLIVERNMCNADRRGIVVPPGSRATSRAQGARRKLGDLVSDHRPRADLVRIGKTRSRSR
jgi:hypothetical protein